MPRQLLTPEEREARYRARVKRKSALNNHVHPDISLSTIRASTENADHLVDPVRGFNRGYFNMGEGCRRVGIKPRSA